MIYKGIIQKTVTLLSRNYKDKKTVEHFKVLKKKKKQSTQQPVKIPFENESEVNGSSDGIKLALKESLPRWQSDRLQPQAYSFWVAQFLPLHSLFSSFLFLLF